jgi:hypothetical protein
MMRTASAAGRVAFRWSWPSPSNADELVKTGGMCEAEIVIQQRRLIELIAPWSREIFGPVDQRGFIWVP